MSHLYPYSSLDPSFQDVKTESRIVMANHFTALITMRSSLYTSPELLLPNRGMNNNFTLRCNGY